MAADPSPLMKQYLEVKNRHPDTIVFFRVGDFYEMFYDDAKTASRILDIALTSRDKNKEEAVPLCGVPYHSAMPYIAKLIRAGRKVAVCEQVEDAKKVRQQPGGGIVRREVVRVITPGTVTEPDLLEAKESLYIASLLLHPQTDRSNRPVGLAYLDLSTGEFRAAEFQDSPDLRRVIQELNCLDPKELLLPSVLKEGPASEAAREVIGEGLGAWPAQYIPDWHYTPDLAQQLLCSHFGVQSLDGYGLGGRPSAVGAAGALLRYVTDNQQGAVGNITSLKQHTLEAHLVLDSLTQRNLELTRPIAEDAPSARRTGRPGTLLGILDKTQTPMGGRLLRQWLIRPLLDLQEIEKRLDGVEELKENFQVRSDLRSALSEVHDLERLIGRVSLGTANARDLAALKKSLKHLPELRKLIANCQAPPIREAADDWDDLQDVHRMIEEALVKDPPLQLREGGLFREGYSPELDGLRATARDGKGWIARLEAQEKQRSGIDSLKVRYNQVFGYYIEVTKANLRSVPQDYIRRQTLVNAERFTTPELKELERKVLGAEERLQELEFRLFEELRRNTAQQTSRIQKMANRVALLDVLGALAEAAHAHHYVRPGLTEGSEIRIVDGRHPVLEQLAPRDGFVPNDALLDTEENRLLLITGPNMAGKSTYMRQVALIVLMAQMGSFIPAQEASIGLVDRIFTRVGAADDLTGGRSTFMVEMNETANITHHATDRSLVLLDEIGRGTSTFDGISIAWAVAEYLHEHIRARTLFATHYHELTDLADQHVGIKNFKAAVREWNEEIIFLRKILEGRADQSYGIQVARLAGLPAEILDRAKQVLARLEPQISRTFAEPVEGKSAQSDLFQHPAPLSLVEEIARTDILQLTPVEALNKLHELIRKARSISEARGD